MPPSSDENQNKPASSPKSPGIVVSKAAALPTKHKLLIGVGVLVLIFAVLLGPTVWSKLQQLMGNDKDVAVVQYFVPNDSYDGPFIYGFSGMSVAKQGETEKTQLITKYLAKDFNFTTRQPLEAKDNTCNQSEQGAYYCQQRYTTPNGRTVYPQKSSGAFVEIEGKLLALEGINLNDKKVKKTADQLIDSLSAVSPDSIAQYDTTQRQKPAWQKLYSLPYQIFAPSQTPNSLAVKFQDIVRNTIGYTSSEQYWSSSYSDAANLEKISENNAAYLFTFNQVKMPANFNSTKNCTDSRQLYSCKKLTEVTSSTGNATVDSSKYTLYETKESSRGPAEGTTDFADGLLADFGKTMMTIRFKAPTTVGENDLIVMVINSLNTMEPANIADQQLMSAEMTAPLSQN